MERLKFLSPDHKTLFKFEGMGPMGAEVRARAFVLADCGWSPPATEAGDGFLAYSVQDGRVMRRDDVDQQLLEHFAQYCAFRLANFSAAHSDENELGKMLEFNVQQEFGRTLNF